MRQFVGAVVAGALWGCLGAGWTGVEATEVTGRILDAKTGQLVAARLYLQAADGTWHFPKSAAATGTALEYKKQRTPVSLEMHTTLSADPFRIDLAPGKYRVRVERGKEYVPVEREFEVTSESALWEISLRRWIDMAQLGWYSGDLHIHRPLADMPNLALAEDLNFSFPLSHWVTVSGTDPNRGNKNPDPTPAPEPIRVDDTHWIHPLNTEYEIFTVNGKSHTLGAVLVLGQRAPLELGVPPVSGVAEAARNQGAFLDLEKHSWPWTPVIAPVMQVDFLELANNHNWQTEFGFPQWTFDMKGDYMQVETDDKGFTEWGWIDFGFKTYYAFLNCGLRMRPSAGTANGVHPVPAGFGRVYVQLEGDEPLTVPRWLAALKAGRSFVTTGPMLFVKVNDQPPGSTIAADGAVELHITGHVASLQPLDRLEIIVNGDVVQTVDPANVQEGGEAEGDRFRSDLDVRWRAERSSWVAVRVFERHPRPRSRFAHSSPVHIEVARQPLRPKRAEVEYFIERVEREIARDTGVVSDEALAEEHAALKFYQALLKSVE